MPSLEISDMGPIWAPLAYVGLPICFLGADALGPQMVCPYGIHVLENMGPMWAPYGLAPYPFGPCIWCARCKKYAGPIWVIVTSTPYCSHITHLGPIWYHGLGSLWAQDGLYWISVRMMSQGPVAHTKSILPMWCPHGAYGANRTRVPFGPSVAHVPHINHMGCPDGTHISAQIFKTTFNPDGRAPYILLAGLASSNRHRRIARAAYTQCAL